ncbi:hypothetical protein RI578_05470 [Streptomyces sp. BB1-1-1]|uniref:hypothetical protein n=1 Tax=Streptomyces sp. BB1-1-1 TaxID=3074430 RepID=UPI002877BFC5|nr:hypothetical protein [Streptomyces sp. BB1-1-1]WND33773.1 hypothetical protein RI578_05470 [Streptomyces sp. BB1-1-1]
MDGRGEPLGRAVVLIVRAEAAEDVAGPVRGHLAERGDQCRAGGESAAAQRGLVPVAVVLACGFGDGPASSGDRQLDHAANPPPGSRSGGSRRRVRGVLVAGQAWRVERADHRRDPVLPPVRRCADPRDTAATASAGLWCRTPIRYGRVRAAGAAI